MSYDQYRTGFRRFRPTAEGLILQINFTYWDSESLSWRNGWRDADTNDVMSIELVK